MNIHVLGCLNCAASCVQLANGSNACVGFERYVTSAIGEGGVLLEFDSTDYDAMETLTREIGARGIGARLLGSATSAVVTQGDPFSPVLMEVRNLTYGDHRWNVSIVAVDGLLFLGACVSVATCDLSTSFAIGERSISKFGQGSAILGDGYGRVTVTLHELDLPRISLFREDQSSLEANFSVGVMANGSMTQAPISVWRGKGAVSSSVASFTRQVAPYVMMQFECNVTSAQTYAHMWAQCSLTNAKVVYVRYAWGSSMKWQVPMKYSVVSGCPMLELMVFVNDDWAIDKGNFTLYVVVEQEKVLGRILTQTTPAIVNNNAQTSLNVGIEVEVLQGLQLTSVYRSSQASSSISINNTDVDALLTFIARGHEGLVIDSLTAIHTHTEAQRAAALPNGTCDGCVIEQLVLQGQVVSPRSCHIVGEGGDLDWIENYVGLVGSSIAADVMQRTLNQTGLVVWINPVWPWGNNTYIKQDVTFIHANIVSNKQSSRRQLLWASSGSRRGVSLPIRWLYHLVISLDY